jgi:dTDP-4-dehydrorhamnose 3,5-epimerase
MKIDETRIPGCFIINPYKIADSRGTFVKTFNAATFHQLGLETNFVEAYYSYSTKNVIRGLHFQVPPMEHTKLVYCPCGEILDAVVDLRRGSPSYNSFEVFKLTSSIGNMVYIPPGLAHGFAVLSDDAVVVYNVTTVYASECDTGILWSSAGIPWPHIDPVISERDRRFDTLEEFDSPFVFGKGSALGE